MEIYRPYSDASALLQWCTDAAVRLAFGQILDFVHLVRHSLKMPCTNATMGRAYMYAYLCSHKESKRDLLLAPSVESIRKTSKHRWSKRKYFTGTFQRVKFLRTCFIASVRVIDSLRLQI